MIPDVTPQQAAAAFAQYGIQPERGTYGRVNDDGVFCGCALTALYALRCGDFRSVNSPGGLGIEYFFRDQDVPDAWIDGVVDGFDGTRDTPLPENSFFKALDDEDRALFLNGFYFGRDVARLVFGVETEEGTV